MIGHGDRFIEEKVRRLVKREFDKLDKDGSGDGGELGGLGYASLRYTNQCPIIPFGVADSEYSNPKIVETCDIHFLGTAGVGVESQTATHIEMIQINIEDYKKSITRRGFYPLGLTASFQVTAGARAKINSVSSEKYDYINANIRPGLAMSGRLYVETTSGKILDTGLTLSTGTSDVFNGKNIENLGVIVQNGAYGLISLRGELNMDTVRELGYTEGSIFPLQLSHCWVFSPYIPYEDFNKIIGIIRYDAFVWGKSLGTTTSRIERG